MEAWLANPSPTATVVFIAPYEKLDARKRITKIIKEHATVIEAKRLQGKDLVHMDSTGSQIKWSHELRPTDAEFLVKMAGDNLLTLSSEIGKMATYLNGKGDITADVIESLVPRTPEMDVFRLTDAYVSGKVSEYCFHLS